MELVGVVAEKACGKCHEVKPRSAFYPKYGKRAGEVQSYCKACHYAYMFARRHKYGRNFYQNKIRDERQNYVRAVKTMAGCSECGERREPCLEFHHVEPSKKLAGVWKLAASCATKARIDAEIAKCVVLCANCHRVHHHNERQAKKRRVA